MKNWYNLRNLATGFFIYGIGDGIAAILANEFSAPRCIGIAIIGALLYGLEIPHYFQWVARTTSTLRQWQSIILRTALAILYFNPLWVSRHLFFIYLLSGKPLAWALLSLGLQSFISALPITVIANLVIQNIISLRYRFLASALFSCCMAIFYPLIALYFSK